MSIHLAFLLLALAAGENTAPDVAALAGDDECQSDDITGTNDCAVNAVQMRAGVSENVVDDSDDSFDILGMVNKVLAKKVGSLNGGLGGEIKSNHMDPMTMPAGPSGKKVTMSSLSGLSSLQIDSLKAESFAGGKVHLSVLGQWTDSLMVAGHVKEAPMVIALKGVHFSAPVQAVITGKKITKFIVSDTHVTIGEASGKVHTEFTKMAAILDKVLTDEMAKKKSEIEEKIAPKITGALSKALNEKVPMNLLP